MLDLFGLIGFAQPWILLAFVALPGLWWLLRMLPPPPRRERFPAIALLAGLLDREDSAARMPWWLLALRLLLTAMVILALADPVLSPQQRLQGRGPVLIVVDNGWATATDWPDRQRVLAGLLSEADRADRGVAVMATAKTAIAPDAISIKPSIAWQGPVGAIKPEPWPADHGATLNRLKNFDGPAEVFWLTDGLETPGRAALAERLQRLGRLSVFANDAPPLLLREPVTSSQGLRITAFRATTDATVSTEVQAVAADGRVIAATPLTFAQGETIATIDWRLPRNLINQFQQLRLEGVASAAGTVLMDNRWQHRLVGLVQSGNFRAGHPLLDPAHYLRSAFTGLASFEQGDIGRLLENGPSVLVMRGQLDPDPSLASKIEAWLAKGGVLLRFAGPGLSDKPDDWLPVTLRAQSRTLGGTLSWETPQKLAPFPEQSPFAGLRIPNDITVARQVLAEPTPELRQRTWASLADGTPLVTAQQRSNGWIVLIHVSPEADWSTLPLSGLFLEMLDRLLRLSSAAGTVKTIDQTLHPLSVLDGYGRLNAPSPQVRALPLQPNPTTAPLGPHYPPGYYGDKSAKVAWNLAPALQTADLTPIARWPVGVATHGYQNRQSRDLGAWLLLAALFLLLTDSLASLRLRGHLRFGGRVPLVAAAFLAATVASPPQARATDELALKATMETHLAYVVTGDASVDNTSAAGLTGLSHILTARTSIEPGPPMPVDIETTELAFFPLLYWPIVASQPDLSAKGRERISTYLERGGTILFDTRDQDSGGTSGPGGERLRTLLEGVRIPPLQPIAQDHVLTRSFYLLRDFPGRWNGSPIWVEADAASGRDGVSGVIIGRNDWAAAWAMGTNWRPLFPVYPGGNRQRELAFRFGVNLAMYVLTGNYKSDQVHIPDILERLGQ
jgi:hypothetical protein